MGMRTTPTRQAKSVSDAYSSSPVPRHIGSANATTQITFQSSSKSSSGSICNGYRIPTIESAAMAPSSARMTVFGPAVVSDDAMIRGHTERPRPTAIRRYIALKRYKRSVLTWGMVNLTFARDVVNRGLFVPPNVRAKLAPAAWHAGQQAQNGAKPQRLMASVPRRWRSA